LSNLQEALNPPCELQKRGISMKDVEMRLIAELVKNSRRSDRELAKVLGISQPTVTRVRRRLEKEGYLREYTVIPDFNKVGFQLAAFILVKMKTNLSAGEVEKARQISMKDMIEKAPDEIVLFERGMGEGYEGIIISFHKDFSDYVKIIERIREYPFVDASATLSFLLDLNDKFHYRYFTFSTLAKYLLTMRKHA
jgi:DNA-binding Lrp family transcriptional regulator